MLTLHRRHKKTCPHTDRYIKLDAHRCPMWIEGMLDGVYRRESLKVSSWEKAEQIWREIEEGKEIRPVSVTGGRRDFPRRTAGEGIGGVNTSETPIVHEIPFGFLRGEECHEYL